MNTLEFEYFPELDFSHIEALNTLATNLSFCGEGIKTMLVTSRYADEGKSFVTMHLMRTLASLNKRVVLVDADLRRSHIVREFMARTPNGKFLGLAHYLAGLNEMDDIIYQTNIENAYFIPIGREIGSSLQLLASERFPMLINALAQVFDVVLIDTPPVGMISDALEMAKYADGALIVVGYKRGRKQEIREVVNTIKKTGCPVLGAILNNVRFDSFVNRKYYYRSERYSYYYKKYGDSAPNPQKRKKGTAH